MFDVPQICPIESLQYSVQGPANRAGHCAGAGVHALQVHGAPGPEDFQQ